MKDDKTHCAQIAVAPIAVGVGECFHETTPFYRYFGDVCAYKRSDPANSTGYRSLWLRVPEACGKSRNTQPGDT